MASMQRGGNHWKEGGSRCKVLSNCIKLEGQVTCKYAHNNGIHVYNSAEWNTTSLMDWTKTFTIQIQSLERNS